MSLLKRLAVTFLVPLALAVVTAIALQAVIDAQLRAQREAERADTVLQAVDSVLGSVVAAETAERGFALTGAPRYLAEYEEAVQQVEDGFDELEALQAGGPEGFAVEAMRDAFAWRTGSAAEVFEARQQAPVGLAQQASDALRGLLAQQRSQAAGEAYDPELRGVRAAVAGILERPLRRDAAADWSEVRARLELEVRVPGSQAAALRTLMGRLADEAQRMDARVASGIEAGERRRRIDEVRRQGEALMMAQRERSAEVRAQVARTTRVARAAVWIGPVGVAVLGFLALALLQWRVARDALGLSAVADEVSKGRLEARANPTPRDPLRNVARAFDQMVERIERRSRLAQSERRTSTLLLAATTAQEAFEVVGEHLRAHLPDTTGTILTLDPGRGDMRVAHRWGQPLEPGDATVFAPQDCWAVRGAHAHASAGGAARCHHVAAERDGLCVPIRGADTTLGVLCVEAGRGQMDADLPDIVQDVAEHLSLALSALSSRAALEERSVRDPLTGLFNRRYLDEALGVELARHARDESPLSVLMVDLDRFKDLNDTHGHAAGDDVLREVGRTMASYVREGDVPARLGGEEFVLVLSGADHDTALRRADDLRRAVGAVRTTEVDGPITVSVGVATAPVHGTTREALLAAADAALYRAKHQGRDRVASPAAEGQAPDDA
ncbi:MAG: diguanylate cyclase [Trueperaceae bacterium]|nr:diguanylate cyclase [Trueperaceae bacterium]